MHARARRASMALLAALTAAACSSEANTSEGGAAASQWTVSSVPVTTIGELDGAPEYLFSRIAGVRLLPDRRVAVADGASGTIRIYGPDGTMERQMGGTGQGPGEFEYLNRIVILRPDTILAYDSQAMRLTRFLVSGELISTVGFQVPDGYPEVYLGPYTDGGHAIAWIQQVPRDPAVVTADLMQLGRFDAAGQLNELLVSTVGMRRFRGPLPFSPHFLGAMIGDTVFHTDGLNGELQATGPGGLLVRTIHAPLEPWTVREARQQLEAELDSTRLGNFSDVEDFPTTDSIPTISELLTDPLGRLWLKQYNPSTDSHWLGLPRTGGEWLALSTSGKLVMRLTVPESLRLMDVDGERIAGVTTDELGVERVQVYERSGG